ncbi:transcriptional regulator [Alistipes onderdonkii subsp. vulgaris]|uniref:helix-turn-helix domain-containing protein n=1 Tax=Alistipes TaxID=239759 RepID=UPI0011638CF9|nr:transcriptional regulator [Alistipes onderdonkii subsp. vulgaris]
MVEFPDMAQKRIYTHDETVDTLVGEKGTARRDAYDLTVELFSIGQTIREIREKRNLTQEDLGRMIGVKKAQISRIENGHNLTVATIFKVFKALDVDAKLYIAGNEQALS